MSHLHRSSTPRPPIFPISFTSIHIYTMGSHDLPSPPAEESKMALSRKNTSSSTKSTKPAHRISKRAGSTGNAAHAHHHDHITQGAGMDGRHKRVWKACERCRMKKTKVCSVSYSMLSSLLTVTSATANSHVSVARTTASSARPVSGRRWSTSNSPRGTNLPHASPHHVEL